MTKWRRMLFIAVTFIIVTIGLETWMIRMQAQKIRSDSYWRLVKNLTLNEAPKCDPKFVPDFEAMSKSSYSITLDDDPLNFTVLMRTYDRLTSIREAVRHYACMPSVDRLILLWSNQNLTPPAVQFFNTTCPAKVLVKKMPSADLTLRFSPFEEIHTDGVFSVDDDVLLSEKDLEHAFAVWKRHSWGLVGQYDRAHSANFPNMTYVDSSKGYSLILTGSAFLHREYLRMFQDKCVSEIREYIDRNRNCEDIFMNFLVKQHCCCSGIFRPRFDRIVVPKNINSRNSLSSRPNHYNHRSKCLQKFSALFADSVILSKSKCTY